MSRRKRYSTATAAANAAAAADAESSFSLGNFSFSKTGGTTTHARMKPHELTFLLRTLSTLVDNGVSLPKALSTMAREDSLARHRGMLEKICRRIESGVSFSNALEEFPHMCDKLTITQLRVGERSGTLSDTLKHLSSNRDKSRELKQAIVKKLAYPCLLMVLGSGLITFLLLYVVPVFEETYDKAGVKLPFITQVLITTGALAQRYVLPIVVVVALSLVTVAQLRKRPEFARTMDRAMLRSPLFGNWLRDISVLQLMEVLNNLMAAGFTLAEALRRSADSVSNRAVKRGVSQLQLAVQRGERFSRELERHEDIFPPIVNQLVIIGEQTGQLPRATTDICEFLRREIERKTNLLVGALEPILTIGLACAIAVVLLAIYLPMFDMVNTVTK